MAHLIDKSALVAEIKRRKELVSDPILSGNDLMIGERNAYFNLLSFIDTLEVKEVDLEKEIDNYIYSNLGRQRMELELDWKKCDIAFKAGKIINFAKHFFELGLRSTITEEDCKLIWTIGDELPYMSEEDFFKELLKRYKTYKEK